MLHLRAVCMKENPMIKKTVFTVLFVLAASFFTIAEEGLFLSAAYNSPYDNEYMDSNVSFGANFGFWGIFVASVDMYTNIIYGEDAFLHVDEIKPLGLYSWGLGLQIPLGNFYFDIDWNRLYAHGEEAGFRQYCSSYSLGFHVKLTETLGLEAYHRTMTDFTDVSGLGVAEELDMIGIGAMIFL